MKAKLTFGAYSTTTIIINVVGYRTPIIVSGGSRKKRRTQVMMKAKAHAMAVLEIVPTAEVL